MPPGVPADRVAAWRRAFDATVKDPAFLADAKKHGADVDSSSGAEVQTAVERTMSYDPALLAKMKKMIGF